MKYPAGEGNRTLVCFIRRPQTTSNNMDLLCRYVMHRELGLHLTSTQLGECSREDSNLHGLPHTVLSRTRLPVPPRELEKLAEAS
jgi:hypothetical protein